MGWLCEAHPELAWSGATDEERPGVCPEGCPGPGVPCPECNGEGARRPLAEGAHKSLEVRPSSPAEVERVWRDFWLPAFVEEEEDDDGRRRRRLNLQKMKGELFDMHHLVMNAPKVYRHVTGGATDDPCASAEGIIAMADHRVAELTTELRDRIEELEGRLAEERRRRSQLEEELGKV